MSPWAARTRGPGHTVRFRYLEWKIQSVNLEVLQYVGEVCGGLRNIGLARVPTVDSYLTALLWCSVYCSM